ncbi:MAG: lysylphosphatidylglycerol synthase transmembrane domain-containing protein [Armatimonadota bacterium]
MKTKNMVLIFKIAIGVILLIFLFKKINFSEVLANFKELNLSIIILIFALTVAGQLLLILRWQVILSKLKSGCSFPRLFKAFFIGLFFNIFLPATVGADAVKGYVLYRDNKKLQISFFSVFVDRYIGLFSLILMAFTASFFVDLKYKGYPLSLYLSVLILIFLVMSFIVVTPWVKNIIISKRAARYFYTIANSASKAVKFTIKNKAALSICFLYSIASYFTVVVIHYFLAKELGVPVGWGLLMIWIPLIALISMAPISINGIGVREFLYIYFFSSCGWDANTAVSVCWIVFGAFLLVSASGGLMYLYEAHLKRR